MEAMEEEGSTISINHPLGHHDWEAARFWYQFVDDQLNGAVCDVDDAAGYTRKLEHNTNLSNSLLNNSGGGYNFSKSF